MLHLHCVHHVHLWSAQQCPDFMSEKCTRTALVLMTGYPEVKPRVGIGLLASLPIGRPNAHFLHKSEVLKSTKTRLRPRSNEQPLFGKLYLLQSFASGFSISDITMNIARTVCTSRRSVDHASVGCFGYLYVHLSSLGTRHNWSRVSRQVALWREINRANIINGTTGYWILMAFIAICSKMWKNSFGEVSVCYIYLTHFICKTH